MALQLHKKHPNFLCVIIISIVLIIILKCVVSPAYTNSLFKPIATEQYFPEYSSSDSASIEQLYGNLYFEHYDGSELSIIKFALDYSTNVYLEIYKTPMECEEAFWFYIDDYSGGLMLENTDEFKVYISRKDISVLNHNTEQCLFVMNGTTLYSISKYSFYFTQKDFKNSIYLLVS